LGWGSACRHATRFIGRLAAVTALASCVPKATDSQLTGLTAQRTVAVIERAKEDLLRTANDKQEVGDIYTQAALYTPGIAYRKCLRSAIGLNEDALGQILAATANPDAVKSNKPSYDLAYAGEAAETHIYVLTNLLILFGDGRFSSALKAQNPRTATLIRDLLTEFSPKKVAAVKRNYPKSLITDN
jgi:hypothetical protein